MKIKPLHIGLFAGGLTLVAAVLFGVFRSRETPTPAARPLTAMTPVETLEYFVGAQEEAELNKAMEVVAKAERDGYYSEASHLSRDELIAAGLTLRQEQYRLEDQSQDRATFYSPVSALYLVMTREDECWRVDPRRTDEMNGEGEKKAPAPSP